jgi:hypothetical protein
VVVDQLWQADHMDLRDDRLEVFGHLDNGEERGVVYAVRAVTAGSFQLPSAEAEAMYDPRHWARVPGGTVEVSGPWDAAGKETEGGEGTEATAAGEAPGGSAGGGEDEG